MENNWTFREWLSRFANVDLPIGDLATDALRDPRFPATDDYGALRDYCASKGAHVADAFEPVWAFYIASR